MTRPSNYINTNFVYHNRKSIDTDLPRKLSINRPKKVSRKNTNINKLINWFLTIFLSKIKSSINHFLNLLGFLVYSRFFKPYAELFIFKGEEKEASLS
jgi:hypothetical protein